MLELPGVELFLCYSTKTHQPSRAAELERIKTSTSVGCGADTRWSVSPWEREREILKGGFFSIDWDGEKKRVDIFLFYNLRRVAGWWLFVTGEKAPAPDSRTNRYAGNIHQDAPPPALSPAADLISTCITAWANIVISDKNRMSDTGLWLCWSSPVFVLEDSESDPVIRVSTYSIYTINRYQHIILVLNCQVSFNPHCSPLPVPLQI